MSKLLESIDCLKGITLNSQLVDLLSILDENISKEEQDKKIEDYINVLKNREESFKKEISKAGEPYKITDEMSEEEKDKIKIQKKNAQTRAKNKFVIDEVIDNSPVIPEFKKSELKDYYFQRSLDLKICDREFMLQDLQRLGFDKKLSEVINNNVLSSMKSIDFTTKEGIAQLNPDDIRNLYSHMFENGNTYDRITFDNAGKYSLYVSVDGETYEPERLDKMVGFAEKHNMKSKINTFMMYCDFPKNLESSLDKKIENGEITESDKKAVLKKSLINYVQDISSKYGDRIDTVDIFNELIYDPKMKEDGFDEEATYHYRKEGWQKYLDIEDLCEMALVARKNMPNTKFTYNDMNWVDPEKRVEIIKIIKQIQEVEKRYIQEGKLKPNERLIDNIGLEAHLTTETSVEEIENTIKDLEENFDLPIEVTELDCARVGKNPLSKEEINKQNAIFRKFQELSKERRISALTIWSQSDKCSFMNNKCHRNVYASVLDDNFEEKDIENMKDINVLLQQKQNEYKIILSKINPEIIKKTLEYIRMQKQNVKKKKVK